ncbi:MAG TPA: hypothetical protein VJ603_07685 [Paucimonas sp.]|nr:hypothetical protein [Paucimonas sp.]
MTNQPATTNSTQSIEVNSATSAPHVNSRCHVPGKKIDIPGAHCMGTPSVVTTF